MLNAYYGPPHPDQSGKLTRDAIRVHHYGSFGTTNRGYTICNALQGKWSMIGPGAVRSER